VAHVRQQLREAFGAALTGLPLTGASVYESRIYPLQVDDLPALRIYVTEESVEGGTIHAPRSMQRLITVNVEVCVRAAVDADDVLDSISASVETEIAAGLTLGSISLYPEYTGIDITWDSGDQPIGVGRMTFQATVFTLSNAPEVAL